MKWLIQPVKVEQEKVEELINMLERAGISYDIVYPLEGQVLNPDKTPYVYDSNETYFVCGSYPLTRNVYKERKESVFSLENYAFDDIMKIFEASNFVNHDAKVIHSRNMVWIEEEYFIRPANDDKSFNGGIYNAHTFNYDGDIVVAKLKQISKEHRFFVINGQIVTGSLYKMNGSFSTSSILDEGAVKFAQEMINKFDYPGFVIDIATVGNDYKIMELNCLNAAGFYDISLYKLVDAVMSYYENADNLKKMIKNDVKSSVVNKKQI